MNFGGRGITLQTNEHRTAAHPPRGHHLRRLRREQALLHRAAGLARAGRHYRAERDSYKLDLALPDGGQIELFSFPNPPPRPTRPEACGLRHLAFAVSALEPWLQKLQALGWRWKPCGWMSTTGKRFTFFADPDGLPLELYET